MLPDDRRIEGLASAEARALLGDEYNAFLEEIELVRGASHQFDQAAFLAGKLSPVFSAPRWAILACVRCSTTSSSGRRRRNRGMPLTAPCPPMRKSSAALCSRSRPIWTPAIGTGSPFAGVLRALQQGHENAPRAPGQDVKIADAVTFKAGERELVEEAVSGDIIGLHNHGTIQIGDTFTEGEDLQFTGIPHFAPELFRRIRLTDPMKSKQLQRACSSCPRRVPPRCFHPSAAVTWWWGRWASSSLMWWRTALKTSTRWRPATSR